MPARRVAIALVVAAVTFSVPAAASAERKAIWGPVKMPDGSSAFPIYQELGVDVFQLQLSWAATAPLPPLRPGDPADPTYRWPAGVDLALSEAAQHGMRVALMVKNTPAWANGARGSNWAPDDPDAYAAFLAAAARRYPAVRQWMIWGEPTRAESFSPLPPNSREGPRRYAVLLDKAYGALKHVRRSNKVIGGMTFTFGEVPPARFLRWMRLPDGRPPRLDWFGHNPFGDRFPNLRLKPNPAHPGALDFGDLDTLARRLKRTYRRRHRNPKLWISEFGVGSSPRPGGSFFVDEAEQARWVGASYAIAHRWRRIAGLGWFTLLDRTGPSGHGFGLLRADGTPKPAYIAYRDAR